MTTINTTQSNMTQFIFTATSITFLVLLAFAVEQLGETFVDDYRQRRNNQQRMDDYQEE